MLYDSYYDIFLSNFEQKLVLGVNWEKFET